MQYITAIKEAQENNTDKFMELITEEQNKFREEIEYFLSIPAKQSRKGKIGILKKLEKENILLSKKRIKTKEGGT